MGRRHVYQNIKIDGKDAGFNPLTTDSLFFNENRWNIFIEPLLPSDCTGMTFIEFGSNVGMFLKLAKKKGFNKVIGIEKDRRACGVADIYRGDDDYKTIHAEVNEQFDCSDLPVADVVLMSAFHYHVHVSVLINLIDQLRYKTRYVLIVSASEVRSVREKAKSDYGSVRRYFNEWKDVKSVVDVHDPKDPVPRKMWSVLLKSPLERFDIDDLYRGNYVNRRFSHATKQLARSVYKNDTINDLTSLVYYTKLLSRGATEQDALKRTQEKVDNLYGMKSEGIKYPVLIDSSGKVLNGSHRLAFAKVAGEKSMIVRII